MGRGDGAEERERFSDGAKVVFAVILDLVAVMVAVALLGSSYLASGAVAGMGAIATGLLMRRMIGRRGLLLCFALAVLVFLGGLLLQLTSPAGA